MNKRFENASIKTYLGCFEEEYRNDFKQWQQIPSPQLMSEVRGFIMQGEKAYEAVTQRIAKYYRDIGFADFLPEHFANITDYSVFEKWRIAVVNDRMRSLKSDRRKSGRTASSKATSLLENAFREVGVELELNRFEEKLSVEHRIRGSFLDVDIVFRTRPVGGIFSAKEYDGIHNVVRECIISEMNESTWRLVVTETERHMKSITRHLWSSERP